MAIYHFYLFPINQGINCLINRDHGVNRIAWIKAVWFECLQSNRTYYFNFEGINATEPAFEAPQNPCKHVEDYIEEFLDPEEDVTKNFVSFLGKMKFAKLNGRQVASFGEEYNYVGSPKSNNKEIPPQLQALIEKIASRKA